MVIAEKEELAQRCQELDMQVRCQFHCKSHMYLHSALYNTYCMTEFVMQSLLFNDIPNIQLNLVDLMNSTIKQLYMYFDCDKNGSCIETKTKIPCFRYECTQVQKSV